MLCLFCVVDSLICMESNWQNLNNKELWHLSDLGTLHLKSWAQIQQMHKDKKKVTALM